MVLLFPDSTLLSQPTGLQYLTFTRPDMPMLFQQVLSLYACPRKSTSLCSQEELYGMCRGTLSYGLQALFLYDVIFSGLLRAELGGFPTTSTINARLLLSFLATILLSGHRSAIYSLSTSAEAEYRGVANR
ncbi:hypothetical protein Tco_0364840 [Tanacetum coccineum]